MTDSAAQQDPAMLAALWCQRLESGDVAPEDRAAFDAWIAADPAHPPLLEEAETIWHGIGLVADRPEMIRYRAEAVEDLRQANARRWSRTVGWRRWAGIAASVLLMIGLLAIVLQDRATIYATAVGERRVVQLADGTRLTLDGASRVAVRMERDSRRLTLLAGRAKFDVAHDPLRPLSVLARNRLTVATGTSFSVELLPRQVRVVLYEGRVEILAQPVGGTPTVLLPRARDASGLVAGRELIASTASTAMRIAPLNVAQAQSWETGMVHFDGEPLALAVERLNRDARTPLVLDDPAIGAIAVSGVFDTRDTAAFVEGITALYPIAAQQQQGRIVLQRKAAGP